MKIGFIFLFAALLLGCGGDVPPVLDATLLDADDATDASSTEDALPDAGAPEDSNPLHDMDTR